MAAKKFCDVENKPKMQEVIKKSPDSLMPPSEPVSLSSLENKGENDNLENCILKGQIIESSNLKGNKNSEEDKENPKTVQLYGTDLNVKSSYGGKEIIKLLVDERSQILKSKFISEEDKESSKTVKMYGTDQNVKSSNGGKEYIKLLTDKRSQILNSNSLEENSCEVL